jgi:hypothetical protein
VLVDRKQAVSVCVVEIGTPPFMTRPFEKVLTVHPTRPLSDSCPCMPRHGGRPSEANVVATQEGSRYAGQ